MNAQRTGNAYLIKAVREKKKKKEKKLCWKKREKEKNCFLHGKIKNIRRSNKTGITMTSETKLQF